MNDGIQNRSDGLDYLKSQPDIALIKGLVRNKNITREHRAETSSPPPKPITAAPPENKGSLPTASDLASGAAWLAKMAAYGAAGGLGGAIGGIIGGGAGLFSGATEGFGEGVQRGLNEMERSKNPVEVLLKLIFVLPFATIGGLFKGAVHGASEGGQSGAFYGAGVGISVVGLKSFSNQIDQEQS